MGELDDLLAQTFASSSQSLPPISLVPRLTRAVCAWQHSGAAIIKKKRFVPEKFCPCTCSYEGDVCA